MKITVSVTQMQILKNIMHSIIYKRKTELKIVLIINWLFLIIFYIGFNPIILKCSKSKDNSLSQGELVMAVDNMEHSLATMFTNAAAKFMWEPATPFTATPDLLLSKQGVDSLKQLVVKVVGKLFPFLMVWVLIYYLLI